MPTVPPASDDMSLGPGPSSQPGNGVVAPDEGNWLLQADELVALDSIYGPAFDFLGAPALPALAEVSDLHSQPPCPGLELRLSVDADFGDGDIRVVFVASSPEDGGDVAEAGPGPSSTRTPRSPFGGDLVSLRHLPPIDLYVTFTAGYPTDQPPHPQVCVPWAAPAAERVAEGALRDLWEPGLSIVHTWVEWLREHFLDAAGMSLGDPPVLQVPLMDGEDAGDVIGDLVGFSMRREMEDFDGMTHTCELCGADKPGTEFLRLPECGHSYCRTCVGSICTVNIKDGDLKALRCPQPDCARPLPHYVIQDVCPEELYEKWDRLMLQRALDASGDIKYCPNCSTASVQEPGRQGAPPLCQCPRCMLVFCSVCRVADHRGETCGEAVVRVGRELDQAAEAALAGEMADAYKNEAERAALRQRQAELKADLQFRNFLREEERSGRRLVHCPKCSVYVEKSEGCNKMVCRMCETLFCFVCGKEISGYDHFNLEEGAEGCRGRLFEMDQVWAWQAQAAFHRARQRDRAPPVADADRARASNCIQCGQVALREAGNNHMRCQWCRSAWCFLCRAGLRGRGAAKAHFGPNHKQHGG